MILALSMLTCAAASTESANSNFHFWSHCNFNQFCMHATADCSSAVRHGHTQNNEGDKAFRYGEALHPGPLTVGTFNPAQMYGSEDAIKDWGQGIWAASETAHTVTAQAVSISRFKGMGFNSIWSPPVNCHNNNTGALRGKASGTAVVTHLPIAKYPADLPSDVMRTSR